MYGIEAEGHRALLDALAQIVEQEARALGLRFVVGQALHAAERLEDPLAELPAAVCIAE